MVPSSLSKENRQRGSGGDDESQYPQGLEERSHFCHGRHPLEIKDSAIWCFVKLKARLEGASRTLRVLILVVMQCERGRGGSELVDRRKFGDRNRSGEVI